MATKLTGMLNLSKISKDLIFTTKKGEKAIFIDIVPNKNGEDEYGNTHAVTLYNKDTRETIYLGNLKSREFGPRTDAPATDAPAKPAAEPGIDDLPF